MLKEQWKKIESPLCGIVLGGIAMMIVCACLAPVSTFHGRIDAMETSAAGTLKNIVTSEAAWKQDDTDGNGIHDYWVGDVSGFYRILDLAGNSVKVMDIAVAKADFRPLLPSPSGMRPQIGPFVTHQSASKSGYFFAAMLFDQNGKSYQQDGPDPDKNAWENENDFGFCAWPADYNKSGINTFIVNGDGVIWKKDIGGRPVDAWPGLDPAAQGWSKVE